MYDTPAMIDYILGTSKQNKLHYVGHSQGTTSFFAMSATRKEYTKKIKSVIALAPVMFLRHMKSNFFLNISSANDSLYVSIFS